MAEDRADGTVLTMTLSWPAGLIEPADVHELADVWSQALDALTRCAALRGHTPSDFGLINVSQDDLDDWAQLGEIEDVLPLLPLQEACTSTAPTSMRPRATRTPTACSRSPRSGDPSMWRRCAPA